MACDILISNFKVNALFDSGSSHSFVSKSLISKLEIMLVCVNETFNVMIPSSEEMSSNLVVLKCPICLSNRTMLLYFVVFPITSFEFIIGMDLLSKYSAAIEC